MEDREPAPWDKDLDSMNYGPPHHLGVAQTVEPTPSPLWYLISKRTNPLYNVLFHKTGVRPWPGSPLNTIPGEEALSALNSWLKDEFIFSIGLRKGRGYFTSSKCFLWPPLKIRGMERMREGLFCVLPRFPQIDKHTCEYIYVNHNEIFKGNHFACIQFHDGFL